MSFLSKRLRDHLTNPKRKIAKGNEHTHRVGQDISTHACNECLGWETRGMETWAEEVPILHEPWCSFYPSLANIELQANLEDQKHWAGSKWDPSSFEFHKSVESTKKHVEERKAEAKTFWASFGRK